MYQEAFGPIDLSRVLAIWDVVDERSMLVQESDDFHRRNRGTPITSRLVDDEQPAGRRPYICAVHLLAVAVDHTCALRTLVRSGLSLNAPWTLLRVAFESSMWVHWLLEPDDSATRRLRGLRLEVRNHVEEQNWESAFDVPAEYRAERVVLHAQASASYRRDCDAMGANWSRVRNRLNLVDEIKTMRAPREVLGTDHRLVEGLWRGLSGHVHGHSYATQGSSIVERRKPIPGGEERVVTINEELFTAQAITSASLLIGALSMYNVRSTQPVRPGRE